MTVVLAVDLGTTGVKVAVIDDAGILLADADEVLATITVSGGGVEQDPEAWWQAIGRCSRVAVSSSGLQPQDVTLVAVTSQYTSTVAVAADGTPLANAIMWMDQRGRRHRRSALDAEQRAHWFDVHGQAPSGNDDLGHVAVFRAEMPEVYAAAAAFVEPMDFVAARLTGLVTATQNTMFPMLCMDNRTWGATEYSDELLAMSGMDPAKLPPLVPMGQPRGRVTAAAAAHLAVSDRAIVMGATIDSVTSAVGTGAVDSATCGLIIGTTSVIVTHVDSKRSDTANGLTAAPSPLAGRWFLVAENGLGGKALDVFVNGVVYPDDGLTGPALADGYRRVLDAAATAPSGANGVMFLPWLAGSMAPHFDGRMRGGFVNMSVDTRRVDMARAVLEGVAMNAAWLLPHVSALAGREYDEVRLGGGGARSALWGQIFADRLGVPVRRLANPRMTNAHGAALLALVEHGTVTLGDVSSMLVTEQLHDPDPAGIAAHRRALESFVDFHERSGPFYAALNESTRPPRTDVAPPTDLAPPAS